ncbi:MAG: hypothetical protein IH897_05525, partial [Planctomycetes bacterium]|nr:hypothetical protein [Planctomycetota bacterium]
EWLREHIHQHGDMFSTGELLQRVTGEDLNPDYLRSYFQEKYGPMYGF